MKKSIVGMGIMLGLAVSGVAQAQEAKGEVLVNPLGLIFGLYNVEGGFALNEKTSLNVGVQYFNLDLGIVEVTAVGASVGAQFFLTGELYNGWYLYPSVSFSSATGTTTDIFGSGAETETTVSALGLTGLGGYQWDWKPFTLRLGLGATYYAALSESGTADVGFNGVGLAADGSIGFTF